MAKKVLVIGGGITGLQTAMDVAACGHEVVLAEKSDQLGGHVVNYTETYPGMNNFKPLLDVILEQVKSSKKITVLTGAEVESFSGEPGNYKVKIKSGGKSVDETVGAVVVATGFRMYDQENLPEYGGGKIPDVIDSMEFEKMLASGEIKRPSDGQVPKEVVFVQCAGSRDPEHAFPYCSKICCMYTAKQAKLYKNKVSDGQAYVFYIDIRAAGKEFEEFVQKTVEEEKVLYLRGKVSKMFEEDGKVMVWGEETTLGKKVEVPADLVVLAIAVQASDGNAELAKKLGIKVDTHGYFEEADSKMKPTATDKEGIFIAGCAQSPKDITDSVTQAGSAAVKAVAFINNIK